MRITMNNIYGSIISNLDKLADDMRTLNETISSGRKYTTLSDDPVSLISALEIRSIIDETKQYERNVTYGILWTDSGEIAVRQTDEIISRAREIAVQMANATQSAATRASAAIEVGHLIEQMVALGNSQVAGEYIFSGQKTNIVPFTYDSAAGTVTYNGDENDIDIRVGRNNSATINKNGKDAFMDGNETSNLFTYLIGLKEALEGNNVSGIQSSLGNLSDAADYINEKIADFGAKRNKLDMKKYIYAELQLSNTERLSDIEDTDLAEAILNLKTKEVAYQAALTAASKVMQLSLVDFMR
ncbi:MAG: flagellar hook-associated protein FlgL [Thermodesulfobacteriota bacterium]|nr:flagellar hook-associated protein FlgL [Thermodesulfobacteriota bacterium]